MQACHVCYLLTTCVQVWINFTNTYATTTTTTTTTTTCEYFYVLEVAIGTLQHAHSMVQFD
jgi:hypothetical protein